MRKIWIVTAAGLLAAALLLATQAPRSAPQAGTPPAAPASPLIERVEAYYRTMFALGSKYQVKVSAPQPSSVSGLLQVTVEATVGTRTSREVSLVSADGRYLIRGEVRDMTADPYAETRAIINLTNQPTRGPADAAVTIVEYSDFQCPYCREMYTTLETKTLKKYANIKLVYKDFPLTNIHPWAEKAALAGQCAFVQSNQAFWQLYQNLFEYQKEITVENLQQRLEGFATAAGLDVARFQSCLSKEETRPRLVETQKEILQLGIESTPMLFVNGRRLVGNVPENVLEQVIEFEQQQKAAASKPAAPPTTQ